MLQLCANAYNYEPTFKEGVGYCRRVARNLQWGGGGGGAVLEAGNNIKQSWTRFWLVCTQIESVFHPHLGDFKKRKRSSLRLSRFFCSNSGDLQKKKRCSARLKPRFSGWNDTASWPILIANANWEGYFRFKCKNRPQRSPKRGILHTLQVNGGVVAPPPPLATLQGYCTATERKLWKRQCTSWKAITNC